MAQQTWWKETRGDWKPLAGYLAKALYELADRKRDGDTVELNGVTYTLACKSVSNSAEFRSRGRSIYWTTPDAIIRISDHWSETGSELARSRKFNCGDIASCRWTCTTATREHVAQTRYLAGRYPSAIIGATISPEELEQY